MCGREVEREGGRKREGEEVREQGSKRGKVIMKEERYH